MTNILVVIYIISSFNLKSTFSSLSASWGRRSLASTKESIVGNLIFTCNQFVMIAVFFFPIKQFFVENIIFGILKIFQRKRDKDRQAPCPRQVCRPAVWRGWRSASPDHDDDDDDDRLLMMKMIAMMTITNRVCIGWYYDASPSSEDFFWRALSQAQSCNVQHLWSLQQIQLGTVSRQKTAVFEFCPNEGGGAAQFFWHLFISALLVNKRSLFPPKCQQFEL